MWDIIGFRGCYFQKTARNTHRPKESFQLIPPSHPFVQSKSNQNRLKSNYFIDLFPDLCPVGPGKVAGIQKSRTVPTNIGTLDPGHLGFRLDDIQKIAFLSKFNLKPCLWVELLRGEVSSQRCPSLYLSKRRGGGGSIPCFHYTAVHDSMGVASIIP